jgi:Sec7-like guanine-nucleotide exchange factor
VGTKILLYSRAVKIDKLAKCLGGKEKKHKNLFQAYLERQDYRKKNIEKSFRSFLQTFRIAVIDS